jgi:hypothetical protein
MHTHTHTHTTIKFQATAPFATGQLPLHNRVSCIIEANVGQHTSPHTIPREEAAGTQGRIQVWDRLCHRRC